MKTFFRYAWPVLMVMAIQGIALRMPADSHAHAIFRIMAFVFVDFAMGWAQWYQYRKNLAFKAEMEALRRTLPRIR